ncbi:MAG: acyltransferase [Chromatiaceae bacterium]|nr:acyltransferase [Chromatiaceae bacterium]
MNIEKRLYPQFDGLRAIAVGFVLYHHWIWTGAVSPKYNEWYHYIFKVPLGGLGVSIFFVLSGFLITEILSKGSLLNKNEKKKFIVTFYIRRALRIFPIYFITISVMAFIFSVEIVRQEFFWFALYLTNILIFIKQDFVGAATHLWTLAIEEQFYLVTPLIVVYFARDYWKLALGLIIVSAFVQAVCTFWLGEIRFIGLLPILSMQALAIGGLLSLQDDISRIIERGSYLLALTMLVVFPLQAIGVVHPLLGIISSYGIIALSVLLVAGAKRGFKGLGGAILNYYLLSYLGVISYGIYLYHNFIGIILEYFTTKAGWELDEMGVAGNLILKLFFTILLANLSWIFIERPINNFKRYFPYLVLPQKTVKTVLRPLLQDGSRGDNPV